MKSENHNFLMHNLFKNEILKFPERQSLILDGISLLDTVIQRTKYI